MSGSQRKIETGRIIDERQVSANRVHTPRRRSRRARARWPGRTSGTRNHYELVWRLSSQRILAQPDSKRPLAFSGAGIRQKYQCGQRPDESRLGHQLKIVVVGVMAYCGAVDLLYGAKAISYVPAPDPKTGLSSMRQCILPACCDDACGHETHHPTAWLQSNRQECECAHAIVDTPRKN